MKVSAKSPEKPKLNKLSIAGIVVIVVLLLVFLLRGWLRSSVAPGVAAVTYGKSVQNTMQIELDKLGDPLKTLGYNPTKSEGSTCRLSYASKLTTSFHCNYGFEAYQEVSTDQAAKDTMNQHAATLQAALQANGWDGEFTEGGDYTSLVGLVKNINNGIDYTPDAAYLKVIGDVTCIFDSNTAFSTPKPAAISSRFSCSRDVNMFGKPPAVIYPDSSESKG